MPKSLDLNRLRRFEPDAASALGKAQEVDATSTQGASQDQRWPSREPVADGQISIKGPLCNNPALQSALQSGQAHVCGNAVHSDGSFRTPVLSHLRHGVRRSQGIRSICFSAGLRTCQLSVPVHFECFGSSPVVLRGVNICVKTSENADFRNIFRSLLNRLMGKVVIRHV